MSKEYEVHWSIYIEADSPEDAAYQCKGILQDPRNEAWVFTVDDTDKTLTIDAQFDDEPYIYTKKLVNNDEPGRL